MAFPRAAIEAGDSAVATIVAIALDEEVTSVVVGQPISLAGTIGASASVAKAFAESLTQALLPFGISVKSFDERFTTTTAAQQLRRGGLTAKSSRNKIDSAAATVLLETFLEATRGEN